ncbi:MAG TPA: hypothetical protein VHM30_17060 [Gemmatimonadaceae bacterium]|nr:hypothetical protein [Gemmatimonadaceae bacterium]
MGGKPDWATRANRPESGGADKDDLKESSGLLEKTKQEFAISEQVKNEKRGDKDGADETAAKAPNVHG